MDQARLRLGVRHRVLGPTRATAPLNLSNSMHHVHEPVLRLRLGFPLGWENVVQAISKVVNFRL